MAAPRPTACAELGEPASNRCGGAAYVVASMRDGLDHRPTGDERRHRVEQLAAAPQDTDAGRAEHLVTRERREVDAELGHVEREMGRRLAGVEHGQRTDRARGVGELADRVDRAEHVGDVGEREDLGALGEQVVEVRQVEPALVGDADPAQGRAGAARQLLPRHEVGVVLHLGDEDLVTLAQVEPRVLRLSCNGVREGVGDEVERLGGVLGEHHLLVGAADEAGDVVARAPS